ncbi:MAG: hypothetical protein H8D96_18485 [Desulfobacterales bacterium]|uniref:Uncharacterized protein n=1 Tax=Candidatus Desulfatibia vada TaxID=2841696 RepID=A0A8J6NV27_9BACT|nr:hypothetical protein [Candidatus Desulfatibia vada]MBL6971339.1 hypothetical protein [Desulfobacterales bacterium]
MMKKGLGIFLIILMSSVCVHLAVIGSANITFQPLTWAQGLEMPIQKIAVMPFLKGKRPEDMAEMVNCPLERLGWNQSVLKEDAEKILTRMVQTAVERRFGEKVVLQAEVSAAYEKIFDSISPKTPGLLAQKLGQALGADAVFLGNVWRYRDRSDMAADAPRGAVVAFNLVLLKVETGQKVWKGTFDQTQRSLTDNILAKGSVKPGLKWLSANELARLGVKEVFKKFPY